MNVLGREVEIGENGLMDGGGTTVLGSVVLVMEARNDLCAQ